MNGKSAEGSIGYEVQDILFKEHHFNQQDIK